MDYIVTTLDNLIHQTAFFNLTWGNYLMIVVACVFLYLAIAKEFEPLLLLPIAFGMLLVNIYPDIMMHIEDSPNGTGGLLYYFDLLDEWAIMPSLIFSGMPSVIAVSIKPGATALTRIFRAAISLAQALVRPITPALAAA